MPSFGNFVSSEPVGPGLYRFGLNNGNSVTLAGPQAEDLNKRLTAGIQPPSLAQGPGALASAPESIPNVQLPERTASDAPTAQQNAQGQAARAAPGGSLTDAAIAGLAGTGVGLPLAAGLAGARYLGNKLTGADAPPVSQPTKSPSAPTAPASAQANESAPEPPQQAAPGQAQGLAEGTFLGYSGKGMGGVEGPVVVHNGQPMVYVAPSKGSPGGFTALGKETIATHAATEASAQEAEQIATQAKAQGVMAEVENMAAQEGAAEEAKWQAALQVQDQQDEVAAKQARLQDLNARYEQVAEEARNATVDENQYMRGARGLFSTLGMAMGAFGAVLGRTPNFAQQFVENQIERNIRKQEQDLRTKRDSENALGKLRDKFDGDLTIAKGVLRQLMTEQTAAQNRAASLSGKSEQMKQFYAETAALGEAKALREREALGMMFNEKMLKDPIYYRQGRAGTSGGFTPLGQEAYEKARAGELANSKLAFDMAKQGGAGANPTLGQRQQAQITSARVARGAIEELADAYGIKRGKDGKFEEPTVGQAASSLIPYGDTRQKLNALKLTFAGEVGKAQTGGVPSDSELEHITKQLDSTRTPGEIAALLNHYDRTMQHVEHSVRDVAASSGPGGGADDGEDHGRR